MQSLINKTYKGIIKSKYVMDEDKLNSKAIVKSLKKLKTLYGS